MSKSLLDSETLVDVAWYRIVSLIVFGITAAVGLFVIMVGESLHSFFGAYGELRSGEISEAQRIFVMNFIAPVIAVGAVYVSVAGWTKHKADKIYLWQARLALIAFCGTCILILAMVILSFTYLPWAVENPEVGPIPTTQFPRGYQPGERLERFFSLCGSLFLSASLAFGILAGEKEPTKRGKTAKAKDQPTTP